MTNLVFAGGAAVVLGLWVLQVYRTRELPISGRGRLAALRVATVAGVLLLLANPTLPSGELDGPPRRWLALDGSRSMGVPGPSGVRPWDPAREAVDRSGDGVRVAVFGDADATASAATDSIPRGADSRLAPILRRAAEAGAREVTVVSDLRISDVPEVMALGEALELTLDVVDVGEALRSAGVVGVDAPATGRAGDPVEVTVEVFGTASAEGAPARVELFLDGEEVGAEEVRLPGPGRTVAVTLPVTLPDRAGPVLWRARVSVEGDAFDGDDTRSAFTDADPLAGILALVSLTPDWEPRFLLPVLARVTGLPSRGWLAVGDDAWLPMDGAGGMLDDDAVARVAQDARILVVHGLTGDAPPWLIRAQNEGRRVIVFTADASGAGLAGVEAGAPRPGEWYAATAAGPLGAAFTGVAWADLPPLVSPLPADSATTPVLELERAGGGRVGGLALQDRGERRRAVVLARGFWRWGFREGPGAEAYDRLWSAVAGWLLALEEGGSGGGIGPAQRVASAERPVTWWAPVAPGGRVAVTTTSAEGSMRTDTMAVGSDGRAELRALPGGSYEWTARVVAPDSLAERDRTWQGRLELEAHTDEFRWPRDTTLTAWGARSGAVRTAGPGRPLRTSPWPYLLLLGLLSAEWILRRRSGLR